MNAATDTKGAPVSACRTEGPEDGARRASSLPLGLPLDALPEGHPRTLVHLLSCIACREAALAELLPPDVELAAGGETPERAAQAGPGSLAAQALSPDQAGPSLGTPRPAEVEAYMARLLTTLEALPAPSLSPRWRGRRYARPEVLAALLTLGEKCLRTEPHRSEKIGLLGVALAGCIESPDAWVPPGLVRAGLLAAAAKRLLGKLKEAVDWLARISSFVSGSAEEAAYSREAGLARWQVGAACEASALLAQAAEQFGERGERRSEGECWALLGLLRQEDATGKRWNRAVVPLRLSLPLLDAQARPYLALRVHLALALSEAEDGGLAEARTLFSRAKLLEQRAQDFDAVRQPRLAVLWTEGRLFLREGRFREAESQLLEVRNALMAAHGIGEAALASLDVAWAAAEQNNPARSASLADEIAFRFQGNPGLVFALQALAVFEESYIANPRAGEAAHTGACRFLRQAFRSQGLRIDRPPFP